MERQQNNHGEAQFMWDEIPTNPAELPFVVLVEGLQGAGKTHFSCTFPEPIFILDSENRSDKVAAKFAGNKKVYRKKIRSFDDIRQALVRGVFPNHSSGTVVIDSASDLQKLAEQEFLREAQKQKIYPTVLWAKVFQKIDDLLSVIRDHGLYCILTARLKDEYVGEGDNRTRTGSLVMEGYKRLPYLCDFHLRLIGDGTAVIYKNGFRNSPIETTEPLLNPCFQTVSSLIGAGDAVNESDFERVEVPSGQVAEEATTAENTTPWNGNAAPEEERLATSAEVKALYLHGTRQLSLNDEQMKSALEAACGKTSTQGLKFSELVAWQDAMEAETARAAGVRQ